MLVSSHNCFVTALASQLTLLICATIFIVLLTHLGNSGKPMRHEFLVRVLPADHELRGIHSSLSLFDYCRHTDVKLIGIQLSAFSKEICLDADRLRPLNYSFNAK